MKKIILALIVLVSFASCEKDDDCWKVVVYHYMENAKSPVLIDSAKCWEFCNDYGNQNFDVLDDKGRLQPVRLIGLPNR